MRTKTNITETEDKINEEIIKENLERVERGEPLSMSLAILNGKFKEAWFGDKKERKREYKRKYYNKPEVKERKREYQRKYYNKPEVKERKREYQRKYDNRPEVKERKREYKRKYYRRKLKISKLKRILT